MAFNIFFKPIVYQDIDEATEWYEAESKGLGKRFTKITYLAFDQITSHPTHYKEIVPEVRIYKIKRFPYIIIFAIKEQQITIFGVIHTKRSNRFLRSRLK